MITGIEYDDPDVDPDSACNRSPLALVLGTLFEKMMGHTGGWPEEWSKEKWDDWFKTGRVPAEDLRDWLRDIALDYGFDWRDMELDPAQAEALGLKARVGGESGSGDG